MSISKPPNQLTTKPTSYTLVTPHNETFSPPPASNHHNQQKVEKQNEKLLIITLAAFMLSSAGCTPTPIDKDGIEPTSNDQTGIMDPVIVVVGEILEIDGNTVHVISGDVVDIFTVDESVVNTLYLGQLVMLTEPDDNNVFKIEAYDKEDFTTRYTNMGLIIVEKTGVLEEYVVGDNGTIVTFIIDGQSISHEYYGELILEIGKTYDFDLIERGDTSFIGSIYDKAQYITAEILELNRADNGELIIYAKDQNGGEYYIPTSRATKNFNLTDLKPAQTITFHPIVIMESFPMQVETDKIMLNE